MQFQRLLQFRSSSSISKFSMCSTSLLLLLLLMTRDGSGYAGGAPDMACLSMLPTGHGVGPQTSDSPFKVFVSKKSYKPGETLQVVIQAEGDNYFRGLILQARMTGCNVTENRVVGTFTNTDQELQTRHCFGEIHSTVSHNSSGKKRLKTFYWTAPVISAGHVVMRATFLREFHQYWSNVESDLVADLHSPVPARCIPLHPDVSTDRTAQRSSDGTSTFLTHATRSEGETGTLEKTSQIGPVLSSKGTPTDVETSSESVAGKNYPSWLGPSFEKKSGTSDEPASGRDPTWLIPAYQKATSKASSTVHIKHDGWFNMRVVLAIWVVLVHCDFVGEK